MECRDAPAERPRPSPGQALSRSLVALDQNSTIIAVVELSQSSWLVAGVLPGIERQPCKKLDPSPERLLAVLHRWQGGGASCNTTHAGGLGAAAECLGRVAARYSAAGLRHQPDQVDRGGSSGTIRAGACDWATRHGAALGSGRRHRH